MMYVYIGNDSDGNVVLCRCAIQRETARTVTLKFLGMEKHIKKIDFEEGDKVHKGSGGVIAMDVALAVDIWNKIRYKKIRELKNQLIREEHKKVELETAVAKFYSTTENMVIVSHKLIT